MKHLKKSFNSHVGIMHSCAADIIRPCGALPESAATPSPPHNHNTTLPVPQNLSVFGHVFPWGSNPIEIQLKSRNRFQDSTPGNSLVLKKNKKRVLYTPSRTRLISGVTNHHCQSTVGDVKKWLSPVILLNQITIDGAS